VIRDIDLASPVPPAADLAPAHFVGIGGAGMSGVARLWLAAGLGVTGSDAQDSPTADGLRQAGARVVLGHDQDDVLRARTVVVSSAVRDDNPEIALARGAGLRLVHRSQALAALTPGRRVVAVAGTNGKTTTSAMISVLLRECGSDPSFCIGGDLVDLGTNAGLGSGDSFVVEADESDGSFVVYRPQVAVVTNIRPDHLDFYGTEAGVRAGFDGFAASLRPGGVLVACADDEGAGRLAAAVAGRGGRVTTYGESPAAEVRAQALRSDADGATFEVLVRDVSAGSARLVVPGRHNVLNALAAVAALDALGVAVERAVAALGRFTGTRRRFELRGSAGGVRVFDDYAHNPGKVAAAVGTGRQVAGPGRLVVAFQPHLFSRTRDFAAEFGAALGLADEVVVLDVFGSREDPLPGVSGAMVAHAVPLPAGRVDYVADRSAAAAAVCSRLIDGDVLLTVGAGDVTRLAGEVLARLGRPR
jgi:UDP-N-acetylmuramate--alanine ligase